MTWPQYPHLDAGDVTPEQVGIYTNDPDYIPSNDNPHNVRAGSAAPHVHPEDSIPESQPMTVQTVDTYVSPEPDAGNKARERLQATALVIKRKALRMWMWTKIIAFLAVCGVAAFGYYSYEHRVKTFVTDHRPCSAFNEDKSWQVTGKRSYSYQNNELFGFRWSEAAAVEEKTELDLGTGNIMVIGAQEGGYWYQVVTPTTNRPVILKPAELYTFVSNNKVILTNSDTFCK